MSSGRGRTPSCGSATSPRLTDRCASAVARTDAFPSARPYLSTMHLEHIGIVVDDLAAAKDFFTALGLEIEGETSVEGDLVDRINGLDGVEADVVILRSPDGSGSKLELAKYRSPAYERNDAPLPA